MKRNFIIIIFLVALALNIKAADRRTLDMAAYLDTLSTSGDIYPAIASALEDCRKQKIRRLVFPKGEYSVRAESIPARLTHITNNGSRERRFAFDLTGMDGLEVDGGGSTFVFSGFVCPFLIDHCSDIRIKGCDIDYSRTFHSEGRITGSTDRSFDVIFPSEYPYEVVDNRLKFTDSEGREYPWGYILELDPIKRETAYMVSDYGLMGESTPVQQLGDTVRIFASKIPVTVGNVMSFGALRRDVPAITVTDSKNIEIVNTTIYHCGAMGVIAQRSRDIALRHVDVIPNTAKGRIVSATADATHFANCAGKITIDSCTFEGQRDDATNIHGIYYRIRSIDSPREITVELAHKDQSGFDYLKPGMNIEVVKAGSLATIQRNRIKKKEQIDPSTFRVTIAASLPDSLSIKDVIAGDDEYPDVVIRNCRFSSNRARGLLIGSRGKVLIENCRFHNPGAAILFEGDARFWFEQAGVRDVTIRNNVFDNCRFGVWGDAIIATGTGLDEKYLSSCRYNRNILIENNTFRIFSAPVLKMYVTSGLIFRNNKIITTTDYPSQREPKPDNLFRIIDCDSMDIENQTNSNLIK